MTSKSLPHWAARRDSNEKRIERALRDVGANVVRNSAAGLPDLLVGFRSGTYLLEVKTRRGKLTEVQMDFQGEWDGGQVFVVRDEDEALRAIGAID